jgi:hypothetical protein
VIIKKVRGLFIRIQGPARKIKGRRVDSRKPEGFLNKITMQTGIGIPRPLDHRSAAEIRSHRRVRGRRRMASADKWARSVSYLR